MQKTLVEPGRYDGNWWLPGAPQSAKVPGTLIIGEDGSIDLQLIGALTSYTELGNSTIGEDGTSTTTFTMQSLSVGGAYPRILGEVGSSGYTLDDCFQTHLSGALFAGLQTQRIHVHQAFSRAHFDADDPLEFTAIVARLHGNQYWVSETGISESLEFLEESPDGAGKVTANTLRAQNLDTKVIQSVDGSTVSVEHVYTIKGDRLSERGFTQHFDIRIAYPAPTALKELLNQLSAVQDLLTVAINRPAAFDRVTLRHADISMEVGGKSYSTEIGLTAKWVVERDEQRPVEAHRVLFTLDEMGAEAVVSGWMKVAQKHRSALARVMTTRYAKSTYVLDNLMNCAAALEAYDREKHGDKIHYVERVKRCIGYLGVAFADFVGDAEAWAKVLKDARNDVAHHLSGVDGASTRQILVARSAFWLFVMCLLQDAGAPESLVDKILGHSDLIWLKEQLAGVMAP